MEGNPPVSARQNSKNCEESSRVAAVVNRKLNLLHSQLGRSLAGRAANAAGAALNPDFGCSTRPKKAQQPAWPLHAKGHLLEDATNGLSGLHSCTLRTNSSIWLWGACLILGKKKPYTEWSRRQDLHPQPSLYKSAALLLSYSGKSGAPGDSCSHTNGPVKSRLPVYCSFRRI